MFCSSIFLKEKLQPLLPVMEQLTNGLQTYNLLTVIRHSSSLFYHVFCGSSCLNWTYEKFENFAEPQFSEDGSSKKKSEIDIFKCLMESVEAIFHEGN